MDFLVAQEQYLEAGVHIGTKTKHGSMREYIYKAREDGLHVLDLKKVDERLRVAAKMLAQADAQGVYIVGSKDNAQVPVKKLCEVAGFHALTGRFTPGRFTNPSRKDFVEPALVMVVDPGVDRQAVREAFEINVPIVAVCDTNNSVRFLDLVIPGNNKGKKSLALVFWVLAREIAKAQGKIANNSDFTRPLAEFEE